MLRDLEIGCNLGAESTVSRNREWLMELLQRFAAGDLDAFEALFHQHQRDVYAWIVRIVRDTGIAEDLTVKAFWRVYRARAQFRSDGNFRAWARRIATNAALDYLRHARKETELLEDYPAPARADSAVRSELRNQIQRAFLSLAPKYRLVAALALIEDETYDQIAEAVGISVALVKVRVFRAVRMLRKKLNSLGVHAAGGTTK